MSQIAQIINNLTESKPVTISNAERVISYNSSHALKKRLSSLFSATKYISSLKNNTKHTKVKTYPSLWLFVQRSIYRSYVSLIHQIIILWTTASNNYTHISLAAAFSHTVLSKQSQQGRVRLPVATSCSDQKTR